MSLKWVRFGYILVLLHLMCSIEAKRAVFETISARIFKSTLRVKNIDCIDLDSNFVHTTKCEVKKVNKTLKIFSNHVIIHQKPVNDIDLNLGIFRITRNGNSLINNFTMDVCEYLNGKENRIFDYLFNEFQDYSNINHSCPLDYDIDVQDVPLKGVNLPIPFSNGQYRLECQISVHKIPRFMIKILTNIGE